MITVRSDHLKWCITLQGHAGAPANRQGHDLVCCAASVLIQALIYSTSRRGYSMEHEAYDGYEHVGIVRGEQQMDAELLSAFTTIEHGMDMLEEAYPEHIRVIRIW